MFINHLDENKVTDFLAGNCVTSCNANIPGIVRTDAPIYYYYYYYHYYILQHQSQTVRRTYVHTYNISLS